MSGELGVDVFLGQIIPFAGGSVPAGWAPCDGALLAISQNKPLFALLGTKFGGDGQTTFALPDLRGRTPVGAVPQVVGTKGGSETVTLTTSQIASHSHMVLGSSATGGRGNVNPAGMVFASATPPTNTIFGANSNPATLSTSNVLPSQGGQPHSNMQPFLAVSYLIAIQGLFPSPPS